MSLRKTYVDSGVLINAFRGIAEVSLKATQVLDDPSREFASSPFVQLETLPKAIYNKQQEETEFHHCLSLQLKFLEHPEALIGPQVSLGQLRLALR